jgi:hypothetical protein
MKTFRTFLLMAFVGSIGALNAQEMAMKNRRNVLKTNILSPLSIGYERGFGDHLSLTVYGLYFPSISYGTPTDKTGYVSLADPSTGVTGEMRYYLSKTKAPLTGTYLGGYYLFRIIDVFYHKESAGTGAGTPQATIKAYIPSDLTSYGLMVGKQNIRAKGFTTDINFGLGYYKLGSIPSVADGNNETIKILNQLSKYKSGIGFRLNFCLGYAF